MLKKVILYLFVTCYTIPLYAQQSLDSVPSILYKRYFHKDVNLMLKRSKTINNPFSITLENQNTNSIGLNGLNRSGSISRAITIGNNQDLTLNSSLNLQLSGRINEELEIVAAISDDNIPIQPEGNTQQIQEFDKVFIQLLNKNYSLTAGDFELRKPNSYFLNYFKKAKGAYARSSLEINKNHSIKNDIAVAIAKGKYNRQQFIGKEGIQGPYRLFGIANETFIIVLAGTERVYVDGVLLKRGDNQDYTIDYNTAELVFMPRIIITAYSRIVVEFEYSDKNYSRSLTTVNSSFENKNSSFRFNYYNEQDAKNKPFLQSLNNSQKEFLSTIGDNTSAALYPSIDSVGFNSSEIRYKKKDSLGLVIYQYSINPEDAIYRINFSFVGDHQGSYIQDKSLANGRVFKWIAPENGIPQGNYEAVALLVAPRKNSMFTFSAEHQTNKFLIFGTELAISQTDLNLFSKLDDRNNNGFGSKSFLEYRKNIFSDSLNNFIWTTKIQTEIINSNFRAIEFYRPVEFNREFNNINTTPTAEQWYSIQSTLLKNNSAILYYKLSLFLKDTLYNGIQQSVGTNYAFQNFRIISNASLLSTELNNKRQKSNYLKHNIDFSKSVANLIVGVAEETERNIYTSKLIDTLAYNSFSFSTYKAYIKSNDKSINKFLLEYSNRLDKSPYQNELRSATRAENVLLNTELNKNNNALFGFSINYRNLQVENNNLNLKSEENIIGRLRLDANMLKGLISTNTFYEVGTGQEPKRAYTYLKVPAGQGVYVFRDYNSNGIQELNEFEIAKYTYEADYIRVGLISTDFVRTKSTSISENILIDPSRKWNNESNYLKYVSMFSNQTNFKIDRKTIRDANVSTFNPFKTAVEDTAIITISTQFRETIFFNRSNPIYGIDYTYQGNNNKNLLSIGFDKRDLTEHLVRSRWNIAGQYSILMEAKSGKKTSANEAASERNFDINYSSIKPEFGIQFSNQIRCNVFYTYFNQQNILGGKEKSIQNKISAEMKYNAAGKSSIQGQFNIIYNKFSGNNNSAIAYEMLEALQVGKNFTWSANWQTNIGPSLQLSLLYDGRSSEGAGAIHAGSMQVRAFF